MLTFFSTFSIASPKDSVKMRRDWMDMRETPETLTFQLIIQLIAREEPRREKSPTRTGILHKVHSLFTHVF